MLRYLLVLFGSTVLSGAAGHGVSYAELQGVKLCLEGRSVQVLVDVPGMADDTVQAVRGRLETSLYRTLTNYQVPFTRKERCGVKDSFILTAFYISWFDDGTGDAYTLTVATSVGQAPSEPNVSLNPNLLLNNTIFYLYSSGFLGPSDLGKSIDDNLLSTNDDSFKDLSLAWWEDNPGGLPESVYLPYVIGTSLTVGIILIGLIYVFRQKRRSFLQPQS
jgi:hypothetical protein